MGSKKNVKKTDDKATARQLREILNQPGTVDSDDLAVIGAARPKSPMSPARAAQRILAARKAKAQASAPKANTPVKKNFPLDNKGSNLVKERLKEAYDPQHDDPADAPTKIKQVVANGNHDLDETPIPSRDKKPRLPSKPNDQQVEKSASCKNCGEPGHTLDKCVKGKSYRSMKKAEDMNKAERPVGQTRSGKPIYASFMSFNHKDYTAEDHEDAHKLLHDKGFELYSEGMNGDDGGAIAGGRSMMGIAGRHYKAAQEKRKMSKTTNFVKFDDGDDQPDEHDIFFHPTGPLGAKTSFSAEGKHQGTFNSEEEAHQAARDWSEKNKFFPNAWSVSDHGNHSLMTDFYSKGKKPGKSKIKKVEQGPLLMSSKEKASQILRKEKAKKK